MYMRRNLKAARKAKKMTQLEVADALHIERSYYTKIERESNTFDVTFKFNNIDFEYLINNDYKG